MPTHQLGRKVAAETAVALSTRFCPACGAALTRPEAGMRRPVSRGSDEASEGGAHAAWLRAWSTRATVALGGYVPQPVWQTPRPVMGSGGPLHVPLAIGPGLQAHARSPRQALLPMTPGPENRHALAPTHEPSPTRPSRSSQA